MANHTSSSGANDEINTNVFIMLIPTFVVALVVLMVLDMLNIILIIVSVGIAIIVPCFLFLMDRYDKNIKKHQTILIKVIDLKLAELKTKLNTEKGVIINDQIINDQMLLLWRFELMLKNENLLYFKKSIKYLALFTIVLIGLILSLYALFSYMLSTTSLDLLYFSLNFFIVFALSVATTCLAFYTWFYFSELSIMDTIIEEYRVKGLDLTTLVSKYLKKIPLNMLIID
jgi:hypothetical protein